MQLTAGQIADLVHVYLQNKDEATEEEIHEWITWAHETQTRAALLALALKKQLDVRYDPEKKEMVFRKLMEATNE